MSAYNPLTGFRRAMRHRSYRNYTIGSMLSLVGTWIHRVALGWLTWEITGSYVWLGIISFADMCMVMVFAPLAGSLADRVDRLRMQIWAQVGMMSQAISMSVIYYAGLADIYVVFSLALMLGIMQSFHVASRLALVPNLVPHEDLTPAVAINSMIFNVSRFIGPAVAGFVIVQLGTGPAFVINAFSFTIFLAMLLSIRNVRIETKSGPQGSVLRNIAEGASYAFRHAGIGPVLLILGVTAFTGRAIPDLLAGYADGVLGRGAEGLAWLASAMGLGATLSGFYFLTRDGVKGATSVVFFSVFLMSASCVAFTVLADFWATVLLLVVAGFAMNNATLGTLNLMQNAVHGHVRGRVMSMYTVIQQGMPAVGTIMIGGIAEITGLGWPIGVAAACGIALWALMMPRKAAIRDALEIEPPRASEESKATSKGTA